ncbi:MAG: phosphoribosylaminoimidazolesuccinocarboxamide synthase [Actinomycetia bacterium]|nr:phosphoribosylaminoimidazolesuccinocarboxamide synthase [Actinomycetes bacterium]
MTTLASPASPWDVGTGFSHIYSGKVRDLYRSDTGALLVVASDRISAYDFILPTLIPDKGKILTQISNWWFAQLADIVPNHLLPDPVPLGVRGRAVLTQELEMYPVECVVRGYLTGSGLRDYQESGSVCGITLQPGLVQSDRLPEAIFTPATKAAVGDHDENVDFEHVAGVVGEEPAGELRALSRALYRRGEELARERGIILADTKFEFGRSAQHDYVLADEVLTPDSSRFWPAADWQPGRIQQSFDKQYVRDWLTSAESGWDRSSGIAPPPLPEAVVAATRAKYVEAYELLTGQPW